MSLKFMTKRLQKTSFLILAIGTGFFTAYQGVHFFSEKESGSHEFASYGLNPKPAWSAKTGSRVQSSIIAIGGIPQNEDQELTLSGSGMVTVPISGSLHYKWTIHGASLVSGELEGEWPGIQPYQTATSKISLLGASREQPQIINLDISYIDNSGKRIQSTSVFSTQPGVLTQPENSASSEKAQLSAKPEVELKIHQ